MKKRTLVVTLAVISALVLSMVVYGAANLFSPKPGPTPNPTSSPTPSSLPPLEDPTTSFTIPPEPTIIVPDNYATIQDAVNNASNGDAILVRAGTYQETITINKAIWLIGENNQTTTIDAHSIGPDLLITYNSVNITGFNLINTPTPASGGPWWMPDYVYPKQLPDITIRNAQNCNVYNNKLTNSSTGVNIENSTNNRIFKNEINNYGDGVNISNSTNNYIAHNYFRSGGTGLHIESSANNRIVNNTFTDAAAAIWLYSTTNNTFTNNTLIANYNNFGLSGNEVSAYINNVDTSNTIDGKPIYYWIDKSDQTVPADAAFIALVNCKNMTVQNAVLSLSYNSVILANTNNSIIRTSELNPVDPAFLERYSTPGPGLNIMLFSSFNNQVKNNQAVIWLNQSNTNKLTANKGNIRVSQSNYNEISNNDITKICFLGDWEGLTLSSSSNNQVIGNQIHANSAGIYLYDGASNNHIVNNTIYDNAQGGIVNGGYLAANPPTSNLIFRNTITDNGNEGILEAGYNTNIIGNSIEANRGSGIELDNSKDCTLIGNVIEGFSFGGFGSNNQNLTATGNTFKINTIYNQYNVWFLNKYPGTFYHNNFLCLINFEHSANVTHIWDNGTQGNYWQSYNGTDANGDGVGDTPFAVSGINPFADNIDHYPLMTPFDISSTVTQNPP